MWSLKTLVIITSGMLPSESWSTLTGRTYVHNMIIGRLWIDHYGETVVTNKSNGEKAVLRMKQCGWFSKGWHEVTGEVLDKDGTPWFVIGKGKTHHLALRSLENGTNHFTSKLFLLILNGSKKRVKSRQFRKKNPFGLISLKQFLWIQVTLDPALRMTGRNNRSSCVVDLFLIDLISRDGR